RFKRRQPFGLGLRNHGLGVESAASHVLVDEAFEGFPPGPLVVALKRALLDVLSQTRQGCWIQPQAKQLFAPRGGQSLAQDLSGLLRVQSVVSLFLLDRAEECSNGSRILVQIVWISNTGLQRTNDCVR